MVIGCSTLGLTMAESPGIRETLAQIGRLGFEACDVAVFENWQNVNPSSLVTGNEAWIDALLEGLSATGLRVSSLNCGLSRQLDDPDPAAFAQHRREMDALLDLAVRVDCPNITVQPGRPIDGYEIKALAALTQQRLALLGPVAQARGVTFSVEGHQGSLLEDPARAVTMMEALWPAVGFTMIPAIGQCSAYRWLRRPPCSPARIMFTCATRLRTGCKPRWRKARWTSCGWLRRLRLPAMQVL